MEPKKKLKGDLESKKRSYLLLGIVLVLSIVYAGFELYATSDIQKTKSINDEDVVFYIEPEVPRTEPLPPKPIKDIFKDIVIEVVSNEKILLNDPNIFNIEVGEIDTTTYIIPIIIEQEVDDKIVDFVQDMPQFIGEDGTFENYIKKNVKYPDYARLLGVTGVVLLEFVVEKDGSVSNVKVLQSVYPDLDAEAIRVVSSSPTWKPGKQSFIPVRVKQIVPIRFVLN